jgi:anti-sigma factor RsiW
MNCDQVRPELVDYQFGVITEASRDDLEQHLASCSSCLREFFVLKREIETAPSGPRPSAAARARLRSAVAREVLGEAVVRPWRWWERPLALSLASAAVVAAVFSVRMLAESPGSMPRGWEEEAVTSHPE